MSNQSICVEKFPSKAKISLPPKIKQSYFIYITMQKIADFVNSFIVGYSVDSSIIQNVQAYLNEKWELDGWISFILSNGECAMLRFNNGVFMNQGFVLNEQKVLKVFGNHQIGDILYNEEQSIVEVGIVDLDHGSRFEGLILTENKFGIPFGYGEMYDDDGFLVYKGIMINWKRFGYGTSYHNNGCIEYEGYWCDDNRFGRGIVYDRYGKLVKECKWYNGIESDTDVVYEGDGSKPLNIGMKHLKLIDRCILRDWDVSWFLNLESIEIGDKCFRFVKAFKIDGLNRLKTIKIGKKSFTHQEFWFDGDMDNNENENEKIDVKTKSFRILNCESLESIQIGEHSFSDFGGDFELKNLPQLKSIQFGAVKSYSRNFWYGSLLIRGIDILY